MWTFLSSLTLNNQGIYRKHLLFRQKRHFPPLPKNNVIFTHSVIKRGSYKKALLRQVRAGVHKYYFLSHKIPKSPTNLPEIYACVLLQHRNVMLHEFEMYEKEDVCLMGCVESKIRYHSICSPTTTSLMEYITAPTSNHQANYSFVFKGKQLQAYLK